MINLDFEQIELRQLATHFVGNKMREEQLKLSHSGTQIGSETLPYLLKYFLKPFKPHEFYQFGHTVELSMNPVYTMMKKLFKERDEFINNSQGLAKLLFESSSHPKIKAGEFNVAFFENIVLGDEIVEAIGIFKSETNVPFLRMNSTTTSFDINHEFGYQIKGIDKGCLVLNTGEEEGYEVLVIDNTNKSNEAQFWKDEFLKLKPLSNEFHQTKQFLTLTKNYVSDKMHEDFEVEKADKIDLLNRSMDYFKFKDEFQRVDFENEVLVDDNIIESFRKYDENYHQQREMEQPSKHFHISAPAVRKQARVFKSVLKLDKNFHIYIHGDRNMIEKGKEEDGRQFYKVYFELEE